MGCGGALANFQDLTPSPAPSPDPTPPPHRCRSSDPALPPSSRPPTASASSPPPATAPAVGRPQHLGSLYLAALSAFAVLHCFLPSPVPFSTVALFVTAVVFGPSFAAGQKWGVADALSSRHGGVSLRWHTIGNCPFAVPCLYSGSDLATNTAAALGASPLLCYYNLRHMCSTVTSIVRQPLLCRSLAVGLVEPVRGHPLVVVPRLEVLRPDLRPGGGGGGQRAGRC